MIMDKRICKKCGKEFCKSIFTSKKEWKTRLYCSHNCANSVNSSTRVMKSETKTKLSKANKGRKYPERSGDNNPRYSKVEKNCLECGRTFFVKNYRKDEAKFCSRGCAYKYRDKGISTESEKIRRNSEYRIWRELIYERDNWTCRKCLEQGGDLNAHHIKNFSDNMDKRFDTDNGITLCRKCHYTFHSINGFKNNTSEQLKNFLAVGLEA
jgi:hypothetical protein